MTLRISDLLMLKWCDVLKNPKKSKEISLLEGKKEFSPAIIMEILNYINLTVTKRYLDIRQDDINDLYGQLNKITS